MTVGAAKTCAATVVQIQYGKSSKSRRCGRCNHNGSFRPIADTRRFGDG
jgi:hypothetical protein